MKNISLDIVPIKDNRDFIKQNILMKEGIIPAPGNQIIIGKIKSGKSVFLANLLTKKEFYKGYFDIIFLFCLSASTVLKNNVPEITEERTYTDGDPSKLDAILKAQKELMKTTEWKKCPSILVLCDDMASETRFMNSPALRTIFFSGSNSKIYCWITSQSYVRIPRSMRLNADSIIMFHGATQISTWYILVYESNTTPSDTTTYATPIFTECTAYDEATRVEYNEAAASSKSITNSANKARFTFNASKTIYGGALVGGGTGPSTKSNTAGGGTMFCASLLDASKSVTSSDYIDITVTITGADS